MRIPGRNSTRRASRWIKARVFESALILGYHRIADVDSDPFGICVSPKHFAEHLDVLRRSARPVRLHDVVDRLQARKLARREVVVTFDDGYADLLDHALPLLEASDTPATIFVTTGRLGRLFWWDRLHELILFPERLADQLMLNVNGKEVRWKAGRTEAGDLSEARKELLDAIYQKLLPLDEPARDDVLAELEAWSGPASNRSAAPALSESGVRRLSACDLVSIGGHTVTHPVLSSISLANQIREITVCKRQLEDLTDKPVAEFSYPNGSWSRTTEVLVRDAGFRCACLSKPDALNKRSNPFRLPRFWTGDYGGEEFERKLRWWLTA